MNDDRLAVALPRRQTLTDGVYEAVKEVVMAQRIKPGAHVNIDQLARDLRVSPTPVREALARLESDGLVTKEPLRGYFVVPLLDARSLEQLFEARMLLEPHMARKAAALARDEQVAAMQDSLDQIRNAVYRKAGDTYAGYRIIVGEDTAFHETIALAAGNDLLGDMLARLRAHLHLYRLQLQERNRMGAETVREHERILAAIRARDGEAASAAMAEHIEHSRQRVQIAAAVAAAGEDPPLP